MDKRERVAQAIKSAFPGHTEIASLSDTVADAMADAAIAALEPVDKPRVKPLEWERLKGIQTDFKAKCIIGTYLVECFDDGAGDYYVWALEWGKIEGPKMESSEAAKAAAQADYESRILAALEPVTVQEAARVILDEVLQKSCPVAAEQRRTMVKACMKARIPSACSSARWTMVNDAIRALAEQDGK